MKKEYDFKDELSKNFSYFYIQTKGKFITGMDQPINYLRVAYELENLDDFGSGLVAIIKTKYYAEEYKKIEKFCVPHPDLTLVGKENLINGLIDWFKNKKINLEKHDSEKHNEIALEKRFGKE